MTVLIIQKYAMAFRVTLDFVATGPKEKVLLFPGSAFGTVYA
jgi:hypothetical protein